MRLWSITVAALVCSPLGPARAHEIYTGVHDKTGQLCCGGNDCAATHYREIGAKYEFEKREGGWVQIPEARITFLPIPHDDADADPDPTHRAHLCYRHASDYDRTALGNSANVFGDIYLYCAFIPPGSW